MSKSLKRLLAIAEKEWIQIRRDARSLILSLFLPVLLLLLFGYALNMDVTGVKMAVYDQDRSSFSRQFIERFSNTEYISLARHCRSYGELDEMIDREQIILALVIPAGFGGRYRAGKPVAVQLLVDGSDSTSATIATGYVRAIVMNFNREGRLADLNRIGITRMASPVDVQSRVWYNEELRSRNFIVPGLIVLVMAIISALITSLTIAREWERGTMESLITTPVRKIEIFAGKLLPYVFIALFDMIVTVSMGHFVFDVPIRGSFVELYLLSLLFLVGTSSIGIMLSSATRSQVVSVQAALMITYLPTLILSGYVFPITNMPDPVQAITYLVPARYLIYIMKGITLKGIGWSVLWTQIIFLGIFALLVGAVSLKKLSLRID